MIERPTYSAVLSTIIVLSSLGRLSLSINFMDSRSLLFSSEYELKYFIFFLFFFIGDEIIGYSVDEGDHSDSFNSGYFYYMSEML